MTDIDEIKRFRNEMELMRNRLVKCRKTMECKEERIIAGMCQKVIGEMNKLIDLLYEDIEMMEHEEECGRGL